MLTMLEEILREITLQFTVQTQVTTNETFGTTVLFFSVRHADQNGHFLEH